MACLQNACLKSLQPWLLQASVRVGYLAPGRWDDFDTGLTLTHPLGKFPKVLISIWTFGSKDLPVAHWSTEPL